MPIVNLDPANPLQDGRQSLRALEIRSGVVREFQKMGVALISELTLANNRRADLIGIDRKGQVLIVEIKSSIEDFRVDKKWPEYQQFCDRFYFATLIDVPADIFPQSEGLIIADNYGCEIIREAETMKLAGATRKALTMRFARASAQRLERVLDYCERSGTDIPTDLSHLSGD
ncbi:MAG: MmcB family DNA repair protein [Rhizobiaceae bacterium]|nr:MmcB family DNA repair protein [Rhizobiaceae bacterium]MBL4696685.1 MmcB family DNA repair protein [Rhizobiaceae bacterium]MBL4732151.1 MmcB family DNA repair protein [Rhizobiaceae bacterium]